MLSFEAVLPYLVVAAIAGAAMVTGLLFAFSNFVMRALAELPADKGMFAMQQINEKIINPVFLLFFLGTPLLCVLVAVYGMLHVGQTGSALLLAGAVGYLVGPLGITMGRNVPMNNELAAVAPENGADTWSRYQVNWQRWNHIRTYVGLLSIGLLSLGLWQLP